MASSRNRRAGCSGHLCSLSCFVLVLSFPALILASALGAEVPFTLPIASLVLTIHALNILAGRQSHPSTLMNALASMVIGKSRERESTAV